LTFTVLQLSVAVGAVQLATLLQALVAVLMVILEGQFTITGGVLSWVVMVKVVVEIQLFREADTVTV
jgi:hypothetical protein